MTAKESEIESSAGTAQPFHGPVDAVIAWVDGNDPAHAAKRQAWMAAEGRMGRRRNNGTQETRFIEGGEIYYCIASILKYAPFIRHIHIVTDQQRPALIDQFAEHGLCAADKIRIVDHRTLFRNREAALPTFNSLAIESLLWNIPGLANHFAYFNDDFFVNAPLALDCFLAADGRLRLHGRLRPVAPRYLKYAFKIWRNRLKGNRHPEPNFKMAQMLSARQIGLSHYLRIHHTPYFMRRDTLADFFGQHPEALAQQIGHRFRELTQFLPVGLANHLEIQSNRAEILDQPCCAYIEPGDACGEVQALDAIRHATQQFGCIQSLDCYDANKQALFRQVMAEKFAGYLPPSWIHARPAKAREPSSRDTRMRRTEDAFGLDRQSVVS